MGEVMGRPREDARLWKISYKKNRGNGKWSTFNEYRTDEERAHTLAERYRKLNTLVFFGEYRLVKDIATVKVV